MLNRFIKIFFLLWLLPSLTANAADSSSTAKELFPLNGYTGWSYLIDTDHNETRTVQTNPVQIQGIDTYAISNSSNAVRYYTNDNDGLRLHQFTDMFGDSLTFNSPAKILNAQPNILDAINNGGSGDPITNSGTVSISIQGTPSSPAVTYTLPYTYTSTIEGIESITVPYGTVNALRIDTQLTINGILQNGSVPNPNFDDEPFNVDLVASLWLENNIGEIKKSDIDLANPISTLITSELTTFTPPPEINSPIQGSSLSGDTAIFNWIDNGHPITEWRLTLGSTEGGTEIIDTGSLGMMTSYSATSLPTNGKTIFARLFYRNGTDAWSYKDFTYTAAPGTPEITSPTEGTTLNSGTVSVSWDSMGTTVTNWAVRAGNTGPGSYNLALPPVVGPSAASDSLSGLPTDGSAFTISLYALINGTWSVVDSVNVTAFTAPPPSSPEITSPTGGTTLTSGSVTVDWNDMGTSVTNWAVRAGSTGPGSYDLAAPAILGPSAASDSLSGLPTDGSAFTISLYALINGTWSVVDSVNVTAFDAPSPTITSPTGGTTLSSGSVTVDWSDMGTTVTNWAVRAGSTGPGSYDLAAPAILGPSAASDSLSGLPTDGSAFTISLYALINGTWSVVDSVNVTAFDAPSPTITSPTGGTTLSSGSVTVDWSDMGTTVTNWAVRAGSTGPGSYDLAAPAILGPSAASDSLSGLPTDGSAFTISLYALINGTWSVVDSVNVTAFDAPSPTITSPTGGTTLSSGSVTVDWSDMGTTVTNWAVRAGSTGPGSYDLAAPAILGPSAASDSLSGLPTDGSAFTISLYALINGTWSVVDSVNVTAFDAPSPTITSPTGGTTLTSGSVTVDWNDMGNTAVTRYAVRAGSTGAGSFDLASPPILGPTAISDTLSGLPQNGSIITITLFAEINGTFIVADSIDVTAFTMPLPFITTPTAPSTLTDGTVSVTWNQNSVAATRFAVRAGSTGAGSFDLAAPPTLGSSATTDMLTDLPIDGSTITITLFAEINGTFIIADSVDVTAFTAPSPTITSPSTSSTLAGDTVEVTWDQMGNAIGATAWAVRAGNTGAGSYNLAAPPVLGPGAVSDTLSGLPTDGNAFTISLYALINGAWSVVDSINVTAASP